MKGLTLYNDANEKFKYKLTLEGARMEETFSRLCLEFDSGENIYFKGKLDQYGNCIVDIKALKNFEGGGKAKIEVIAENTFFTIHEMPFEVKKKINVKLNKIEESFIEEMEEEAKPIVGIIFEPVEGGDKTFEFVNESNESEPEDSDSLETKDISIEDFMKEKIKMPEKSETKKSKPNKDIKRFDDF